MNQSQAVQDQACMNLLEEVVSIDLQEREGLAPA